MEVDLKTHEIFINSKCGLISMTKERIVYDTQKSDFIFFYPSKNRITVNRVIGRSKEENMPIISTDTNDSEWEIENNEELQIALDLINNN